MSQFNTTLAIDEIETLFLYEEDMFSSELTFLHQKLISSLIPASLLEKSNKDGEEAFYKNFHEMMPLLQVIIPEHGIFPQKIQVSLICPSHLTSGVGSYFFNVCGKEMLPGKELFLPGCIGFSFRFKRNPSLSYLSINLFIHIQSQDDLILVEQNLEFFKRKIKVAITTVIYLRQLVDHSLRIDELHTLLDMPQQTISDDLFEQTQNLFLLARSENHKKALAEEINPLLSLRSAIFRRDMFNEIQRLIPLFHPEYFNGHTHKFLTRLVSYIYLIRKELQKKCLEHPEQRYIHIKLLQNRLCLSRKPIVGVLLVLNLLHEHEIIDHRHLTGALNTLVPDIELVAHTSIHDFCPDQKIKLLYLEIAKLDQTRFNYYELSLFRKQLPMEIKSRIESVNAPLFIPRNEEDALRTLNQLSSEVKRLKDIPQVSIAFHNQTDSQLFFTILIVKITRHPKTNWNYRFQMAASNYTSTIYGYEERFLGLVRNKYRKDGYVLEVAVPKKLFIRRDFSIDLMNARKTICAFLNESLGKFRDYNGGLLSKQADNLDCLKKYLGSVAEKNGFLLENFFHSIYPTHMQSILPPQQMAPLFLAFLDALDFNYKNRPFYLYTEKVDGAYLLFTATYNAQLRNLYEEQIHISRNFVIPSALFNACDLYTFAYIFHDEEPFESFYEHLKSWLLQFN